MKNRSKSFGIKQHPVKAHNEDVNDVEKLTQTIGGPCERITVTEEQ